jgi:hypothetical protein
MSLFRSWPRSPPVNRTYFPEQSARSSERNGVVEHDSVAQGEVSNKEASPHLRRLILGVARPRRLLYPKLSLSKRFIRVCDAFLQTGAAETGHRGKESASRRRQAGLPLLSRRQRAYTEFA